MTVGAAVIRHLAWRSLEGAFGRAAEVAGSVDRYYALGGHRVLMRFAGAELATLLTRAFAHRIVEPGDPGLTISVWDGEASRTEVPRALLDNQSVPLDDDPGEDKQAYYDEYAETLSMVDTHLNQALYCLRGAALFPETEVAAPLRYILTAWMARRGAALVHAGAVGTAAGGVLLVGKGGSGKSTSVMACLQSDLCHAGEDYVLVSDDPLPVVHSLYQSAKLEVDQLWRLPHLSGLIGSARCPGVGRTKGMLFVGDAYPEKLIERFPIRAILIPRVASHLRTTRLVPHRLRKA